MIMANKTPAITIILIIILFTNHKNLNYYIPGLEPMFRYEKWSSDDTIN